MVKVALGLVVFETF